jgi:hypothetical protein
MEALISNKVLNKTDRVVLGSIIPSVIDSQLISLLQGQNAMVLTQNIADSLIKIFRPLQPLLIVFEGEGDVDPSSCSLVSALIKKSKKLCPMLCLLMVIRNSPTIPVSATHLRTDAINIELSPLDKKETELFSKSYLGIVDKTVRMDKKIT